jgi:hypothetical protein
MAKPVVGKRFVPNHRPKVDWLGGMILKSGRLPVFKIQAI